MDTPTEEPQKRQAGALAAAVAANIEEQREAQAIEAAYAVADQEPAFDRRKGESNFGKRIAAKIRLTQQQ